eukprot:scaffold35458_cov139-Skeletonema_dohrnii-CCMP3373.AAC.1
MEGGLLVGGSQDGFGFSFTLFGRDGRFLVPKRLKEKERKLAQCEDGLQEKLLNGVLTSHQRYFY